MPRIVVSFSFVLAVLVTGCHHSIPDMTMPASPPHATVVPPAGQAAFVGIHGGRDGTNLVLFTADGTPVCQLPHASHCLLALTPGHYRLYVAWDRSFIDAIDLDVIEGHTYYATFAPGWGYVDEKLTPSSPQWIHLNDYMAGAEVAIDPSQMSALRTELGNVAELVRQGDQRMDHYDDRHREAHTIHPGDGS
jgi:hypothetical protein